MYFDTAFIAKCYLPEPESERIQRLVAESPAVRISAWGVTELHWVFHRALREGRLPPEKMRQLAAEFAGHVAAGQWIVVPVDDGLLRRVAAFALAAPADLFLRSADAIHLTTAQDLRETEIWTTDRHMLAAAPHFGLRGRTL